jgi:hypothetical protein
MAEDWTTTEKDIPTAGDEEKDDKAFLNPKESKRRDDNSSSSAEGSEGKEQK